MNRLPSNWKIKYLGKLCEIKTGRKDVNQGNPEGKYPFFTCAKDHTYSDIYSFDCEALLIAGNGDVGNVSYYKGKFEAYQRTYVLMGFTDVMPRFLYHVLDGTLKADVSKQKLGNTMPYIKKGMLTDFEVPLPPLQEQSNIVAILDEVFAGITQAVANAERNLANARELFDSYLNGVFSKKGEGWVEKRVGEIANHYLGKMLDKKKNKGSMKPYLRNLNVRWFDLELSDLLEMRFEESEEERYSVLKGDLLICEGGYPGRATIWQDDEPIFFQKAIHRVRCKEPLINRWLMYFLYLSDATGQLQQYFTGAGIQHFTGQALKRFQLPLAPLKDIAVHLTNFDHLFQETRHLETIYQKKLTALGELKQSILQKAFTGELTTNSVNRQLEN